MAYLDLFLRSITSENVMEVFLRVLLTEAYDSKPLINLLIYHINSDSVQVHFLFLFFCFIIFEWLKVTVREKISFLSKF